MSLYVDIQKDFGTFVLDSRFELKEGILGFLGASGSGKSMTLKCIAGIETPDRGRIVLNDRVLFDSEKKINLPPQKRKVGYLFQNYGLFPNMSVEKNIETGIRREKNRTVRKQLISEMIERMQLTGLEQHKPSQLSGGQQQRTALARILINAPEILLLDEPFSALDAYLRERLVTEMKKILKDYNKNVIIVSHSRNEIYQLCDEIAIIADGNIHGKGPVKKIFADPGTINGAILTGCKNIARAEYVSENKVFVPDWNASFVTKERVRSDIKAIGIRAHYFNPKTKMNMLPVEFVEEIEEPFEWILKFRYKGMKDDVSPVWWRLSKERRPKQFPAALGISEVNIMLLYDHHMNL